MKDILEFHYLGFYFLLGFILIYHFTRISAPNALLLSLVANALSILATFIGNLIITKRKSRKE